ncbi:MAG: hypothetical protein KDC44_22825, partial [Phaeodactylibacter sp.]|nr:hypothetical protein [Phaeodactylibacter sp.]
PDYQFEQYDLAGSENWKAELRTYSTALQASMEPATGPLFKVALFQLAEKDGVLLAIHHLLVDGVSWRILLEDLNSLYQGLQAGLPVQLPAKTDAFLSWAQALQSYAQSAELKAERRYWSDVLDQQVDPIGQTRDRSLLGQGELRTATFSLGRQEVEQLVTKTHRAYNTEINDILLTALGLSLGQVFDAERVCIELEGHGRENILPEQDITRTVGWFTSIFPLVLPTGRGGKTTVETLIEVKESLRKLPNKGVGFGILQAFDGGFTKNVESAVLFNYLGDFGTSEEGGQQAFRASAEDSGPAVALENLLQDPRLHINALLSDGHLQVDLSYNDRAFDPAQIAALSTAYAQILPVLIRDLSSQTETYLTPSDLTYPHLPMAALAALNTEGLLEDVYRLSPLQQGIFYHWLSGSSAASAYLTQRSYRLELAGLE